MTWPLSLQLDLQAGGRLAGRVSKNRISVASFPAQGTNRSCCCQVREGFKNPSHGICPLGGYPPPLLNGRENLAKKVNGKGGYPPSPHSGRIFF